MRANRGLQLEGLAGGTDIALLIARVITGVFLIYGVWDNVVDGARMREFVGFMRQTGFPNPQLLAPFSVVTQLIAGVLLVPGLLTRVAGVIVAITFVVGYVMVHMEQSLREGWPALSLVALGLIFATVGGGSLSLDRLMGGRR